MEVTPAYLVSSLAASLEPLYGIVPTFTFIYQRINFGPQSVRNLLNAQTNSFDKQSHVEIYSLLL